MTIAEKTYAGTPGAFSVSDPDLANVIPLRVCREGLGFTIVIGSAPGNREVQYSGGGGTLTFQDAFSGNIATDISREQVYIRYKY